MQKKVAYRISLSKTGVSYITLLPGQLEGIYVYCLTGILSLRFAIEIGVITTFS